MVGSFMLQVSFLVMQSGGTGLQCTQALASINHVTQSTHSTRDLHGPAIWQWLIRNISCMKWLPEDNCQSNQGHFTQRDSTKFMEGWWCRLKLPPPKLTEKSIKKYCSHFRFAHNGIHLNIITGPCWQLQNWIFLVLDGVNKSAPAR